MEELFNILSSSARLNKKKKPKKELREHPSISIEDVDEYDGSSRSRDRTGKRDESDLKKNQIHKEEIAAFRSSMGMKIANKHDPDLPDPISKFQELRVPSWWRVDADTSFQQLLKIVLANIERGQWKEPTPIQMQALPALLDRRDFIGAAFTGSGKSGAFLIPTILLTSVASDIFYHDVTLKSKQLDKKSSKNSGKQGEIRGIILAPSSELAAQLHREAERLSTNLPGGRSTLLLSKSNAANVVAGTVGGKKGLDILVATPLRLVDSIQKGLRLDAARIVVLDECDRLLDAADGQRKKSHRSKEGDSSTAPEKVLNPVVASGSSHTQTFLAQMDTILAEIPATAVRALFSATVTPTVRSLAESILRNPVDVTIRANSAPGGANPDIMQKLMFVGREEGKLLAIRQIVQRGELLPPVIIFLQSKERAQALFSELLYDGIHVDVIHAGRSKSARDNAVAKFRRGETWVLISTDICARGVDFKAVNMVINYDVPESGVTYVHRIGRCARNGRKGEAITFFTESDFPHLRTIANVMKQSGCPVEEWMLKLSSNRRAATTKRDRKSIDTTPRYDKEKQQRKRRMIHDSRKRSEQDNAK
jgi:ATP-dependent RNA helicase DDX52/ROK1